MACLVTLLIAFSSNPLPSRRLASLNHTASLKQADTPQTEGAESAVKPRRGCMLNFRQRREIPCPGNWHEPCIRAESAHEYTEQDPGPLLGYAAAGPAIGR